MTKNRLEWALLAAIIAASFLLRLLVMDIPFERDEGEYAYAAQLLLDGVPPFKEAYNMKFPGIYAVYAAILFVFGQTHTGVHLALAFVNGATSILVFLIGRRLFGPPAALAASVAFAMLSFLPSMQGIMANSEHFVLLAALAGILTLMKAMDKRSLSMFFIAGALLGLGYTIKQHGAAFVLFGYFLLAPYHFKNSGLKKAVAGLAAFTIGATLPFLVMCALLYSAGVFDRFWFWSFSYAAEYVSVTPFSVGMGRLKAEAANILLSAPLLWIIAAIGLFFPLWDKEARRAWPFMASLLAFSALAVMPGFFFRPHYFLFLVPATALFFGAALKALPIIFGRTKGTAAIVTLSIVLCVYFAYTQRTALAAPPEVLSRQMYGYNPFPEALVISDYIAKNTAENEKIAVLGSEPEIYFYTKRRAATGFIYTYPLMERQRFALDMQKQMMDEVKKAAPAYLVFVDIKFSWGANDDSSLEIFDWLKSYVAESYTLVGMADIKATGAKKYAWGRDIENVPAPMPGYGIYIYKRN
ncbi:MAG: glycosyltransferase family 39 protein [Deltaproteobacteria bacterium]|nr:glycosyltransferase family 39 protein [Deltaproteobacteria bacterium]